MSDQDLNSMLNSDELKKYAKEAEEKWGNTEAYKQSQEKLKKLGTFGMIKIAREMDNLMKDLAKNMDKGEKSKEVQKLIEKHYNSLSNFYQPNLVMYRSMGSMYVDDKRFSAFFDKHQPGLAEFMKKAIDEFCDRQEAKK